MYDMIRHGCATAHISIFESQGGIAECHAMIGCDDASLAFESQLSAVEALCDDICATTCGGLAPVFKRYCLSDAANQCDMLDTAADNNRGCAVSVVQQPPSNGTKVALWAYMLSGVKPTLLENGLSVAEHGGCRHLFATGLHAFSGDSYSQTWQIFLEYVEKMKAEGCTLADNCIRTWLFVSDIDNNYGGVVKARNDVFAQNGLTADTHFIASTGIGGRRAEPSLWVQMDAYAVGGLRKEQLTYLYAKENLSRTSDYGVSFERGTAVDYGDRRHVFISGTASIDSKGEILHWRDITAQTLRMLENVEALLAEARCTFADVAEATVYLRDSADHVVVRNLLRERFAGMPMIIVNAPVCRPGWLVEMECIAIHKADNQRFPNF